MNGIQNMDSKKGGRKIMALNIHAESNKINLRNKQIRETYYRILGVYPSDHMFKKILERLLEDAGESHDEIDVAHAVQNTINEIHNQ